MFKPVSRTSLADSVFAQLRDHIVSGDLRPGAALPAERILAEQLGVNRGAVREGLKRLEQAGLVAKQHGGSTRVLDFTNTGGLELLAALIVREGRLNTRIARSVLELRSALAPDVARAAAQRIRAETLQKLQKTVVEMERTEDLRALQRLAMQFWGEVVEGTDNLAYRLAYNSLDATYGPVQDQLTRLIEPELRALDDYTGLVSALQNRDPERAAHHAQAIISLGAAAVARVLGAVEEAE